MPLPDCNPRNNASLMQQQQNFTSNSDIILHSRDSGIAPSSILYQFGNQNTLFCYCTVHITRRKTQHISSLLCYYIPSTAHTTATVRYLRRVPCAHSLAANYASIHPKRQNSRCFQNLLPANPSPTDSRAGHGTYCRVSFPSQHAFLAFSLSGKFPLPLLPAGAC